jgi:hypothetical protein
LAVTTKVRVPASRVDSLRTALQELRFWRMGSWQSDDPGIDPTWWLVEGLDHGRYDLFERVAPRRDDPVRAAGRLLLELAGLEAKGRD